MSDEEEQGGFLSEEVREQMRVSFALQTAFALTKYCSMRCGVFKQDDNYLNKEGQQCISKGWWL